MADRAISSVLLHHRTGKGLSFSIIIPASICHDSKFKLIEKEKVEIVLLDNGDILISRLPKDKKKKTVVVIDGEESLTFGRPSNLSGPYSYTSV